MDAMMIPEWTLGDRMRKAMESKGLTVQEISDELGVTRSSASNWIHGRVVPRKTTLIVWSLKTGVPLEWLLEGRVPDQRLPHLDSNQKPADYQLAVAA
jgi:transcriptional regulator with XRE-family HTH domain